MNEKINLYHGDCLEKMKLIEDCSVDLILTDPPYGTTACKWDTIIPFDKMWDELNRVIKPNGAIVLFGSEPFSTTLRMSNIKNYKYDWYWLKPKPVGFLNAKIQPLRNIVIISVFNSKIYYPQDLVYDPKINKRGKSTETNREHGLENFSEFSNYPKQTLEFKHDNNTVHPTQKPVDLLEYLIKTYTLEDEVVLDFTMGSGSTGVACMNTNRNFIGIERDDKYFEIAKERIEKTENKKNIKTIESLFY